MDHQVLVKDNYELASSKNKSNKSNKSKVQKNQNKTNAKAPKAKHNKNSSSISHSSQVQQKSASYPSWTVFNNPRPSNKSNSNFEVPQAQNKYIKNLKNNHNKGYSSDKNPRSINPLISSDSDGSGSTALSDFSGFRIVQGGKTLIDETSEDMDMDPVFVEFTPKTRGFPLEMSTKFASSELTVGPNFKMISLPMFLQTEQSVMC